MPIGSESIRRASGAMKKPEKKVEKQAFAVQSDIAEIEIKKISGKFDFEVSDDLKKSVKKFGVIEPVTLLAEGEKFTVISGSSRIAAAKACGLLNVRAVIVTLSGSGITVAKRDLTADYKNSENEVKIALNPIHENKFNAIRAIGKDLPDYLL